MTRVDLPRLSVIHQGEHTRVRYNSSKSRFQVGQRLQELSLKLRKHYGHMTKTILVTGGGGFIGSHLCEKLLEQGNNVLCLDNFCSSTKENIAKLLDFSSFEFIRHDVTYPISLEVDQIYHLACPASPIHYQKDPVQTVKTNVFGSINILGLAKRSGARVLLASTSEVYGDPLQHPQTEDYLGNVNTIGPRACYDEGKRCAETLFFDYHRQHSTDIRIARIFNTYGPRMMIDDGRVVSNFIMQALKNEDITIYGDGTQTRSFCYISDLIVGLMKLMDSDTVTGPINLGNPSEFTIQELAHLVIELTSSSSKIVYLPMGLDDPRKRKPSIAKAKDLLSWEPKIELEQGLKVAIQHFKTLI